MKDEALRLADDLTKYLGGNTATQAAAELRRLAKVEDEWMALSQDQGKLEGQIDRLVAQRDEARRTVREAHEAGTRLVAQRDALLKVLKDVLPVAEDASESLGRFCGDEGWAQEDMDRMDNVDGMLPLIRAAIKAVEGGEMTDREYLELAAKAAGIEVWFDGNGTPWVDGDKYVWNPLTDDGDALRLAVKLRIDVIQTNIRSPQVHALADAGMRVAGMRVSEDIGNDPLAATRRAIVRAAAEIGKGTK